MLWLFGDMAMGSARLGVLIDRVSRSARFVRVPVAVAASGESAMTQEEGPHWYEVTQCWFFFKLQSTKAHERGVD